MCAGESGTFLMEYITKILRGFSTSWKTVSWVSLGAQCGRNNEINLMIYTYLNSAKLEDSGYTNFYA